MKLKLVLNILGLIAISFQSYSQKIDSLYTEDLQKISLNSLEISDFLVISNTNCISCVHYLLNSKLSKNVIIITQNLSLLELQRIKSYYSIQKKSTVYFYDSSSFSKIKGPFLLLNKNDVVNFETISLLSNDFNTRQKKFYRKLKNNYMPLLMKSSS